MVALAVDGANVGVCPGRIGWLSVSVEARVTGSPGVSHSMPLDVGDAVVGAVNMTLAEAMDDEAGSAVPGSGDAGW